MTTQQTAEALLFDIVQIHNESAETSTNVNKLPHRRIDATYCPLCSSWVEVRLCPFRLHCTGCGVEARP